MVKLTGQKSCKTGQIWWFKIVDVWKWWKKIHWMRDILEVIIYKQQCWHSDWLRACQLIAGQCKKVKLSAKKCNWVQNGEIENDWQLLPWAWTNKMTSKDWNSLSKLPHNKANCKAQQKLMSAFWLVKSMSINRRSVQKSEIKCKMVKLKMIDSSYLELGQTKWQAKIETLYLNYLTTKQIAKLNNN